MMNTGWVFLSGIAALTMSGCLEPVPPADPGAGSDLGADAGSAVASGLPCDVQAVLATHCQSCHSDPPLASAQVALVSYDDLMRPATADPGVTLAERSLLRMTGTPPMPPLPASRVSAAEIALVESWLAAGAPTSSCDTATDNPFDVAPTCTSNTFWTRGESGSSLMLPGDACIACHESAEEAPSFSVAGTLYPTAHEPTSCNGVSGGASIEITDANGVVVSLPVNTAGNFYLESPVQFPIRAKVIATGEERAMASELVTGDCNTCHTQDGTSSAPGRIILP